MAIDPRFRPGWAILQAVLDGPKTVDLVRQRTDLPWRARFCFPLFWARAMVDSLAVDLCPVMELGFHRAATADFFAARFWPAPGSPCPESLCCFRIDFAMAPADFVVAV